MKLLAEELKDLRNSVISVGASDKDRATNSAVLMNVGAEVNGRDVGRGGVSALHRNNKMIGDKGAGRGKRGNGSGRSIPGLDNARGKSTHSKSRNTATASVKSRA